MKCLKNKKKGKNNNKMNSKKKLNLLTKIILNSGKLVIITLLISCTTNNSKITTEIQKNQINNQIIVKYKSDPNFIVTQGNCATFNTHPNIDYCEPDYIVQTTQNTNHKITELWNFESAKIRDLWNTLPNSKIIIAVIDEGVDISHPDLKNNIWINTDEIPDNGIDDDQNGYIDDIHGWNFINNSPIVFNTIDGDSHGTHVAGTIAGVIGVNPKAKIMALKFISPSGGRISDATKAIQYALDNGALLSNHSYGAYKDSQTLKNIIKNSQDYNHTFIAAAGNDNKKMSENPFYPASYEYDNIISVAATTSSDSLSFFSNYGIPHIDVAAPGSQILSTLPNNQYGKLSGTSMATPLVTGIISIVKTKYPQITHKEIKERLIASTTPNILLQDKINSGGIINAKAFLELNEQLSSQKEKID